MSSGGGRESARRARSPQPVAGGYGSFPAGQGAADPAPPESEISAEDSSAVDLEKLGPVMASLEGLGLFRSESMDMSNDPRFFQASILNKRLAAFSGLGVVSGLMVGFTQSSVKSLGNMDFTTLEGKLHGLAFLITSIALFANIIATYVSVAQVYHVYRLESAGPTGFEMATSYYLNANIVAWRHLAIKCLLLSLPLFLVSTGIQIEVSLGSASSTPRRPSLMLARCCGIGVMCLYCTMGAVVLYIHSIHSWIFRDRYQVAMEHQTPFMSRLGHPQQPQHNKSVRRSTMLDV